MTRTRRPDPQPLEANDTLVSGLGAAAWAIALAVLLIVPLDDSDHWWRWVCVTGLASGLFGLWYVPHLQRKRAAAEARRARERASEEP